MLKLDMNYSGSFLYFFVFFQRFTFGVREQKIFGCWQIFCPVDLDLWIRIFMRIRIQEAKMLQIQRTRIRILNIVDTYQLNLYLVYFDIIIFIQVYLFSICLRVKIYLQWFKKIKSQIETITICFLSFCFDVFDGFPSF